VALTTSLGVLARSGAARLPFLLGNQVARGLSAAVIPMTLLAIGQDPAQSLSIILATVT